VLNKHIHGIPSGAVYVGRGSPWGNPFRVGRDGDRETVVRLYCEWVLEQPDLMARIHELRGKDLVCFCAPKLCHAMVLRELANPDLNEASPDTD